MLRVDFAHLDSTFNDAVIAELKDPELSKHQLSKAPQKKELVAGLAVLSLNVEDGAGPLARRRKKLKDYRLSREEVSLELMELGIEPLGIIPVVALEKLFQEYGLINLAPDSKGCVHIHCDAKVARALSEKQLSPREMCSLVFPRGRSPRENECSESVERRDTYGHIVRKRYDRRASVKIALPQPPADVQKILHKARGLPLKVAAVPEAISFIDDLAQKVDARLKTVRDRKKRDDVEHEKKQAAARAREAARRAQNYDPIVYTELGSAAAIITQFGEFEMEKKVIEAIADSQYLV